MKPISVTAFLFTLEKILLENNQIPIKDIKSLPWEHVEYFVKYVDKRYTAYPAGDMTYKMFKNFKKNYKSRRAVWVKEDFPEEVKQVMRRARDELAVRLRTVGVLGPVGSKTLRPLAKPKGCNSQEPPLPSASDRVSGCDAQSFGEPTLYELQNEIDKLWDEIANLRKDIAKYGPESGTSCDPTRTVYDPKGMLLDDFRAVLQSVTSKRHFARARQQVALLVLYISGLKVSKLLLLEVRHLKILAQFPRSGELLTIPIRDPAIAKELLTSSTLLDSFASLIGDRPDSTPAFRAHYSSERPCTRESLTLELNQILSPWKFTTQHFSYKR